MLKTSFSWPRVLPIAVAAATVLVIPSAAQAASYKFKVTLSTVQTTDWAQTVRHPAPGDGYCGERDVHWEYRGDGDGQLKAKIVGGRVTFKGTKKVLQSSEIKMPGTVVSDHSDYTITQVGTPDPGCDLPSPPPPPHPTEACGALARRPGIARSHLLVFGGRLTLTGGFYRRDKQACADPSLYTGLLGYGGRPKRRDVNDLIVNRRVRSIELSSSDTTKFTAKNLSDFGANSKSLEGSGEGKASWHVKLTRIP
jgi:hypothetical protein